MCDLLHSVESVLPRLRKARICSRLAIATASAALAAGLCACSRSGRSEQSQVKSPSQPISHQRWNPSAAQTYLDQRENWWMSWSTAARDQDTFCVACHTSVPYILAQPALRATLGETTASPAEVAVLQDVTKRVRLWDRVQPYYSDAEYGGQKGKESRSTEAVLNALLLASRDSELGELSDDSQLAFQNMWRLQLTDGPNRGAWLWQQFWMRPWESNSSTYSGAAWAALAVGIAPNHYQDRSEIQGNIEPLREYLTRDYSKQSVLNQAYLLWASTKLNSLLSTKQQQGIIDAIFRQQRSDGGWRLTTITWSWREFGLHSLAAMWRRDDWTLQEKNSDGLATGLLAFVLREAGVSQNDPRIAKAQDWLVANQDKKQGTWQVSSLNKRRDPSSNVGLFMTDAATAFAVLALAPDSSNVAVQKTAMPD